MAIPGSSGRPPHPAQAVTIHVHLQPNETLSQALNRAVMKHYETVQIPARTEQKEVSTTCDLCKKEIDYWEGNVDMECKKGSYYPEGGSGILTTFDVCGQCWKDLVVPIMAAAGATPRTREVDY
jgi:hypothetical protein